MLTPLLADFTADNLINSAGNLASAGVFAWAVWGLLKDTLKSGREQMDKATAVFREELAAERASCSAERALDRQIHLEMHQELVARFDRLVPGARP